MKRVPCPGFSDVPDVSPLASSPMFSVVHNVVSLSGFLTVLVVGSVSSAGHQEHGGEHSHGVVQRLPTHRLQPGREEDLQTNQEQGRA